LFIYFQRRLQVRLLGEDVACFGKTGKGRFFGFKLHVMPGAETAVCRRFVNGLKRVFLFFGIILLTEFFQGRGSDYGILYC